MSEFDDTPVTGIRLVRRPMVSAAYVFAHYRVFQVTERAPYWCASLAREGARRMIPDVARDTIVDAVRAPVSRPRWVVALCGVLVALAGAIMLALAIGAFTGCTHASGRPYTPRDVYKMARATAIAACDAVDGPLGTAVAITIDGASFPVAVARAACVLVRLTPSADFVVVDADGHGTAVSREPVSSGN